MTNPKPTIAGLMQLVDRYGRERMIGMEMDNEGAIKRARSAVQEYAERFAPGTKVKCDGNHGGPRCADPECWNDSAPQPSTGALPTHGGQTE